MITDRYIAAIRAEVAAGLLHELALASEAQDPIMIDALRAEASDALDRLHAALKRIRRLSPASAAANQACAMRCNVGSRRPQTHHVSIAAYRDAWRALAAELRTFHQRAERSI